MRRSLEGLRDERPRPRIPASVVGASVVVLFLVRLASLNALEQCHRRGFWKSWLRADLPSADSTARIAARIHSDQLRSILQQLFLQMRRRKVWPRQHLSALILDGHESSASYSRSCESCLQRQIQGIRTQHYHRNVTAMLRAGEQLFLADLEPQRPKEDEVAAASRLFQRLVQSLPDAFSVVVVDALYARAPFFLEVRAQNKHVLAVLKHEERDLMQDARSLFARIAPREVQLGPTKRQLWDESGFLSWSSLQQPVRVVRCLETTPCPDGTVRISDWFWVTTLPAQMASTETVVTLGRQRWSIENEGFNELVNHWNVDHVFHHHPGAILNFTLLAFLAYNLFHLFYGRNLKPAWRERFSKSHLARLFMSELYEGDWTVPPPLPP